MTFHDKIPDLKYMYVHVKKNYLIKNDSLNHATCLKAKLHVCG